MDFQTLKEKINDAVDSIKSKFSKGSKEDNNSHPETEGMMSVDDYFDTDTYFSDDTTPKKSIEPKNTEKKKFDFAKTFLDNPDNYNPFADQEVVKKVDKKEFKENWFRILIKIIIFLIMLFLGVLCFIMIYRLGYSLLHDTDVASFNGYSDYLVREDNLSPMVNENDLIIVQSSDAYQEGDIILYVFAETSHKIGRIVNKKRGFYIIEDNTIKEGDHGSEIPIADVLGKEVKKIKDFKSIYNFITSPITIVMIVIVIALYFYLISKGKMKDKGAI